MGKNESIGVIREVVNYSYKLLMQKMRIVNDPVLEGGCLAIENEASMQLELGVILKTIGHLYEFTPNDKFIVLLEKKEKLDGAIKTNKSDNEFKNYAARIDIYIEYNDAKAVLELKYLLKRNGAEPDNRFRVYADLYNLELCQQKGYDLCFFILVTDNEKYVDGTIKGNAQEFIMRDGDTFKAETPLKYSNKCNKIFYMKYNYTFKWDRWNRDSVNLYFLKLELPANTNKNE